MTKELQSPIDVPNISTAPATTFKSALVLAGSDQASAGLYQAPSPVTATTTLTTNNLLLGAGANDTKISTAIGCDGTARLALGVASTTEGSIVMYNTTSGSCIIRPATGALGTTNLRFPAAGTDTIVTEAATQTLTNKSIVATQLTGTVPAATLGSGSSITTKFLRGDNTWQTVAPDFTSAPILDSSYAFRGAVVLVGDDQATAHVELAPVTNEEERTVYNLPSGNTVLTLEIARYDMIVADNPSATSLEVPENATLGYTYTAGKEIAFFVQRRGAGTFAVNFTGDAALIVDNDIDPSTLGIRHTPVCVTSSVEDEWNFE